MQVTCAAPGCNKKVNTSKMKLFKMKLYSKLHGGSWVAHEFCPEHKERVTSGRFNDGDNTTNPDLNNNRPK